MKLLLDENLSRRIVPFLQHAFPGSTQVALLGLQSATDQDIWNRAKSDGYVVVTRDADFQELSLVWGSPPQVVRLRTPNLNRASVLEMLLDRGLLTSAGKLIKFKLKLFIIKPYNKFIIINNLFKTINLPSINIKTNLK
jgi:predicted nuclease of predicted toxin-antitoxin system